MKMPLLLAVATYTPLTDSASAVIAPEHASSVNVDDLAQSLREIVTSSERMYQYERARTIFKSDIYHVFLLQRKSAVQKCAR